MINVLPQNEKTVLHKEYLLRLTTVCLFIFSGFAFSALFLLMPAYVLSTNKIAALEIEVQKYNESNSGISGKSLSDIITQTNQNLEILNKNTGSKKVTEDILDTVLSAKPTGIKILSILYVVSSEGKHSAQINGQALDRTSLRAFEDALKREPSVESTDLPVSNFTKRSNIDFSLTVFIK